MSVPDEIWAVEDEACWAAYTWDIGSNSTRYLRATPELIALIEAALDTAAADCDRLDAMNAFALAEEPTMISTTQREAAS